jgi:cysteine desulfurase
LQQFQLHSKVVGEPKLTPILPEVLDTMLPYLAGSFGNPSSVHSLGSEARTAMENSRSQVAELVQVEPESVLFTSSATEAINTVFAGVNFATPARSRVVVTAVEHAAVLENALALETRGFEVIRIRVSPTGQLDMPELERALLPHTVLASIMWANNETGILFPIHEVVKLCNERGIPLHVDAVQAVGKVPVSMSDLDIDFLSISAHKIHGPKGIGALILGQRSKLRPLLIGGHQESGRRAGTENVHGIVGFGYAAQLARENLLDRARITGALRDRLETSIKRRIAGAEINGGECARISNTANVRFEGVDSDALVGMLDSRGVCASTGSACNADSLSPSHVLMAMTGSYDRANEAVRFSLSHLNTELEIDNAAIALEEAVASLRMGTNVD